MAALDPLIRKKFNHVVIDTGQHYDFELSQQFFGEFKIPKANYTLGIKESDSYIQIAKMLESCGQVLQKEKPDLVIVYGDTNSTLSGALASTKLRIPTVHIEAGIRSNDTNSPEEHNRKVVDALSTYLLCPTKQAVENLKKENLSGIFIGDIMLDLFNSVQDKQTLPDVNKDYYFVTIHRQENTENIQKLLWIMKQLESLDKMVIFPIHPRTKKALKSILFKGKNITFVKPVSYAQSISLIKKASFVITDSGGIQKEAYWAKVPCITVREKTEWPETLKNGWNTLHIFPNQNLAKKIKNFKFPTKYDNYFGTENISKKALSCIEKVLGSEK